MAARPGAPAPEAGRELSARATRDPIRLRTAPGGAVYLARCGGPAISSSGVRALLVAGRPVGNLVPVPVLDHIRRHSLYRGVYGG